MYRILIVEDEPEAADLLRRFIARYGEEHGEQFQVTTFSSADELLRRDRTFDLIFLDIELPEINGMEAANLLRTYDTSTPIIFVTNLAQYAVRGYEVDALDFIVKPVGYFDFSMRMNKAMRILKRTSGQAITVTARGTTQVFPQADLVYVEVVNHDLVFHTTTMDPLDPPRMRGSLKKLEQELPAGSFLRISSSCLINMNHVRLSQPGMVRMSTGETLYVSRSNRKAVMNALAEFLGGSI